MSNILRSGHPQLVTHQTSQILFDYLDGIKKKWDDVQLGNKEKWCLDMWYRVAEEQVRMMLNGMSGHPYASRDVVRGPPFASIEFSELKIYLAWLVSEAGVDGKYKLPSDIPMLGLGRRRTSYGTRSWNGIHKQEKYSVIAIQAELDQIGCGLYHMTHQNQHPYDVADSTQWLFDHGWYGFRGEIATALQYRWDERPSNDQCKAIEELYYVPGRFLTVEGLREFFESNRELARSQEGGRTIESPAHPWNVMPTIGKILFQSAIRIDSDLHDIDTPTPALPSNLVPLRSVDDMLRHHNVPAIRRRLGISDNSLTHSSRSPLSYRKESIYSARSI